MTFVLNYISFIKSFIFSFIFVAEMLNFFLSNVMKLRHRYFTILQGKLESANTDKEGKVLMKHILLAPFEFHRPVDLHF